MSRQTQPTPEALEAQAEAILAAAERDIPALVYPVDRHTMTAVAATAQAAGCIAVWPTTTRPVQIIPIRVWQRAVELTSEARKLRLARMRENVMAQLGGA